MSIVSDNRPAKRKRDILARKRRSSESEIQRETCLSRDRRRRQEKILNESQEERDRRLKMLSNSKVIRIQNESQGETLYYMSPYIVQ